MSGCMKFKYKIQGVEFCLAKKTKNSTLAFIYSKNGCKSPISHQIILKKALKSTDSNTFCKPKFYCSNKYGI